jgi:hypothetical protein
VFQFLSISFFCQLYFNVLSGIKKCKINCQKNDYLTCDAICYIDKELIYRTCFMRKNPFLVTETCIKIMFFSAADCIILCCLYNTTYRDHHSWSWAVCVATHSWWLPILAFFSYCQVLYFHTCCNWYRHVLYIGKNVMKKEKCKINCQKNDYLTCDAICYIDKELIYRTCFMRKKSIFSHRNMLFWILFCVSVFVYFFLLSVIFQCFFPFLIHIHVWPLL